MNDTIWLDLSDVCQMLNVTKQCLHNWRRSKLIPFSNIGGKYFYKKSDIEDILNKNYKQKK